MGELALFQPREAFDAKTRLAGFIRHAREDLAVFGASLDWDAPAWQLRGVARVSGRSKNVLRVNWGHPLKSPRHRTRATRRSMPGTSTSSRHTCATGMGLPHR